jgi:hypothetical protein
MRNHTSSTQFFADQIEQLDLALDQLALKDRNFDRFAILLVDNVVELGLHHFAQQEQHRQHFGKLLKSGEEKGDEKNAKLIASALGQHFDGKVKLAKATGVLTGDLADSINYLHNFRNTAHHSGLRHEGILHALALFYFRSACSILKSVQAREWMPSASSADVIPVRATKYLGRRGGLLFEAGSDVFEKAWQRLQEVAESMGDTLVADLHRDLKETVDWADGAIGFLANDGPTKMTRDAVLIEAQVWARFTTDEVKAYAAERMPKTVKTVADFTDWLRANYPWPVKNDPVPGWRQRLLSLEKETDPQIALRKYCDFLSQTEELRELILGAARELDGWIQEQIDIARGK